MRKTERKVAAATLILGPATLLAWKVGSLSSTGFFVIAGFAGAIGTVYVLSKKNLLASIVNEQQERSRTFGDAWTEEESRNHLKNWSKENYTKDNKATIRWDQAMFKSRPVKIGDSHHKIHCFIFLGDNDRGTQVFVDATEHEIIDHLPLLWTEQLENPFKFCDYHEAEQESQYLNAKALESLAKTGRRTGGSSGMLIDSNVQQKHSVRKNQDSDDA